MFSETMRNRVDCASSPEPAIFIAADKGSMTYFPTVIIIIR